MIETINGEAVGQNAATVLALTGITTVAQAEHALAQRHAELAALEGEEDPAAFAASLPRRNALRAFLPELEALHSKLVAVEPARLGEERRRDELLALADSVPSGASERQRLGLEHVLALCEILKAMRADAAERNVAALEARNIARRIGDHAHVHVPRTERLEIEAFQRALGEAVRGTNRMDLLRGLVALITPDIGARPWTALDDFAERTQPPPIEERGRQELRDGLWSPVARETSPMIGRSGEPIVETSESFK